MGSLDDERYDPINDPIIEYTEQWSLRELLDRLMFPGYWPPGLPDQVMRWLRSGKYDPRTMPNLLLADHPDGNVSLLGWRQDNEDDPNLIQAVRGFGLTEDEMRVTKAWPNVAWCPRCWQDAFVPYDAEDKEKGYAEGFTPPALSRMDNETYICSACGQDEAMRDYNGEPPIPPNEWPIGRRGFGWGGPVFPGGLVRGPYGTNEGDKWLAPGSDVQNRLDAEGEGLVLIHEIIDGEEKLYTTALPELIQEATEGHARWLAEQGRRN